MRSALVAAALVALAGSASASTFLSILPPGQDGLVPVSGTPGPHAGDQVAIYADLILAAPGLKEPDLLRLYKDAGIAAPATPERVEHPRAGVTIARDAFGVPHVMVRCVATSSSAQATPRPRTVSS